MRAPSLLPLYPYAFDSSPVPVLHAPLGATVAAGPSASRGLIRWRMLLDGIPLCRSGAGPLAPVLERMLAYSTLRAWRDCNSENSIRSSRERGRLLPTIYLPLDMPPIIARTIGEGGQLDISGHQKITLSGITHYRPNAVQSEGQRTSLFPDLRMEQELQVRLEGTIGEKIHVDVDHDSEREMEPENRIRLAYEGWEDEIVQSIEMGDVSLAITGPEFVSYSIPHEGLFGAKVVAQAGPVDITTIASKEASTTETAEFVGQATMVTDSILEIDPAENYFFLVNPDTEPQPVIAQIRVFVDDLDVTNNDETGAVQGGWFVPGGETGEGFWDELLPGPDQDFWVLDSTVIEFRTPVNDNFRVAVWVVTAQGDTIGDLGQEGWNLRLIKDSDPFPSNPTWYNELRNRYFLGYDNIVQESFLCDIYYAPSGEQPVATQNGVPFIEILGLDTNGDGSLSDEENAVDWENGFIVFPDTRPFMSDSLDVQNPAPYEEKNPEISSSRYFIAVSYRAASTTYSLGNLGIVPGSERVVITVNGVDYTLTRDVDYTIIYEIGLLSLMGEWAEKAQDPGNTLRVSYEYLPFLAAQQKTLFGTRAVYNLGQGTWIGATAMFENTSTPDDRPRVGEESSRTMVADIDARLETHPVFLSDFANAIPGISTEADSRFILSGEVAASFPDPNTDGRAYIDDMEGAETSLPVGQTRRSWSLSSNPLQVSGMIAPNGEMKWYNVTDRWRLGHINDGLEGDQADEWATSVLEMCFTPAFGSAASWGGVMRCMDRYGIDLSKKTHVRLYVRATGTAQGASLYLDLGERIDEDSWWLERVGDGLERRANGELDTEDTNGNGTLEINPDLNEDTGLDGLPNPVEFPGSPEADPNRDDYYYNSSVPDPVERFRRINGTEDNAWLDTEDLNRNGLLDRSDSYFRIRIPLDDPDYIVSGPNQYGWMLVEVPLSDSALVTVPDGLTSEPSWEKIVYARLWVEGFTQRDTIDVFDFSIVGNRWEPRPVSAGIGVSPPVEPGELVIVSTVNNQDNPDYAADPPPGIDPGRDEQGNLKLEQSISIESVGILPGHECRARQTFYSSEDYTGYSTVRFPVHGSQNAAGEFFYRMGSDSLNYYEIAAPLTPGWQTVTTDLDDLTDLKQLRVERDVDFIRVGNLSVRGNPNLAAVVELSAGIRNTTASALSTTAWLDDLTLRGPYSGIDAARRISATVDVADLMSISGDYRFIGADFHGLGQRKGQGSSTTSLSSGLTLNLDRFTPPLWSVSLPATLAWKRQLSEPRFAPSSDIRLDGDESWEQRTESEQWDTGVSWRRNRRSTSLLSTILIDPWTVSHNYTTGTGRSPSYRDSLTSARARLGYDLSLPQRPLFSLPVLGGVQPRPSRIAFGLQRDNGWDTRWSLGSEDTVQTRATRQRTFRSDGSLGFNLWSRQSASISLAVTRDLLYPWRGGAPISIGREIQRSQSLSLSQEITLWDYLVPRVSYEAAYGSARLAPHTASGEDSLGSPDVSLTATRRLDLRIGLVKALHSIARLRDERLDEQAEPGSPRWLLSRLDRWADRITDPTVTISRTLGSEYDELGYYPGLDYRFGLVTELEGVEAYDRTRSDNVQVSTGFRPTGSMSVRGEYSSTDSRHYYSGYWNRQMSKTWPSVTVSWSGLERIRPFSGLLRSGTLSTGYRLERGESGRFESGDYIRTSATTTSRWSPLFSVSAMLRNEVQITLSDNISTTETRNYTGTNALTRSSSGSVQVNIQYSFSSPGGLAIPLPLLDRLRIRFQSDLTTALLISRSGTKTEILVAGFEDQLQSDRVEWRIEPSASYDFGTVTAGLKGIYGWKTDKVNSVYDQRDFGLDIWATINF